jgi:ADP-ribosylglycohydrolase
MDKRYEAMFVLHSLGDTIGFKNGVWEFNHWTNTINSGSVNEFIYEFISLGGINGLDISEWIASDDTLYHMAMGNAMLLYKGEINDKFLLDTKNELIKKHNQMVDEIVDKVHNRYPGTNTSKVIDAFTKDTDALDHPYDDKSGGNGCAMRSLCIGSALYGQKNRTELVNVTIRLAQMTHNSAIGFLGGLTTALFTAFAIEGLDIYKWPTEMLKIMESSLVKSKIDKDNNEMYIDYITYMRHWRLYIDTRFDDGKPINSKSHTNPVIRIKYYYENFVKDTPSTYIGGSSYACCIIAYDSLIDSDAHWEKLIVYSALHPGDSDTIGAVAGGLYGILYGYGDVPDNLLNNMEYGKELKDLGKKVYTKYYKK